MPSSLGGLPSGGNFAPPGPVRNAGSLQGAAAAQLRKLKRHLAVEIISTRTAGASDPLPYEICRDCGCDSIRIDSTAHDHHSPKRLSLIAQIVD
jgi:hypothetical protein